MRAKVRGGAEPDSTGEVLLEEFGAIHGSTPEFAREARAGFLERAKSDYEDRNGASCWDRLSPEQQEEKARLLFYFDQVHGLRVRPESSAWDA